MLFFRIESQYLASYSKAKTTLKWGLWKLSQRRLCIHNYALHVLCKKVCIMMLLATVSWSIASHLVGPVGPYKQCYRKTLALNSATCVSECNPLGWSGSGSRIQDHTHPSVPMNHDLSDSESLILIQIISKGCTLSYSSAYPFWRFWWAPGVMSIIHYSCTGLKGKQRYIEWNNNN